MNYKLILGGTGLFVVGWILGYVIAMKKEAAKLEAAGIKRMPDGRYMYQVKDAAGNIQNTIIGANMNGASSTATTPAGNTSTSIVPLYNTGELTQRTA